MNAPKNAPDPSSAVVSVLLTVGFVLFLLWTWASRNAFDLRDMHFQ